MNVHIRAWKVLQTQAVELKCITPTPGDVFLIRTMPAAGPKVNMKDAALRDELQTQHFLPAQRFILLGGQG